MYSKLGRNFSKVAFSTSFLALSLLVTPAHAVVNWTEVGDAGDLLGTAQAPVGEGRLRSITGTVSTNADVDLYKIFINNPTTFSASVTSTTGNFDSVVALFNSGGFGVYGNDDAKLGSSDSGLPAGSLLGPQAPGWYYLAVFGLATTPTSGNDTSPANYIAPDTSSPFTSIIGASGPGGASPLTGWAPVENVVPLNEEYSIRFSGVSPVPEPETYAMLVAGLALMGAMVRRRKASTGH
jgi:hypothetical protein